MGEHCKHIFQPIEPKPFYFKRPAMACQFCGALGDRMAFDPTRTPQTATTGPGMTNNTADKGTP